MKFQDSFHHRISWLESNLILYQMECHTRLQGDRSGIALSLLLLQYNSSRLVRQLTACVPTHTTHSIINKILK